MHWCQSSALAFVALGPLVLWLIDRGTGSETFRCAARRTLAVLLVLFESVELATKFAHGETSPAQILPMQLCDWALFAVAWALWFRSQAGFDLGYFWGLAGTIQALITPAIDATEPWWRLFGFFYSHALIVVGVLHLLLTERLRPTWRSLVRVLLVSEIFLATTLAVNALTGGNYGFLTHPPENPSLLDLFSKTRWLYVAQINLTAWIFFTALYLPWLFRDVWRAKKSDHRD